ncbi:MAG: glycoside hydrolase family 76 protein [Ferruginibacter sp.]
MVLSRCIFYVSIGLILSVTGVAQTAEGNKENAHYCKETIALQNAIDKNFFEPSAGFYKETVTVEKDKNAYSYLWPLCGLIQANNEIDKLTGGTKLIASILNIIQRYYDPAPPSPGYASYIMKYKGGDRFYDDNQWIGIACMDAYEREKKPALVHQGKLIYQYMMTGFDSVLGGGLYWQENKKVSKNTCSNGPGIILALQLYQATKKQTYLDTALMLYNWVNKQLKAPSGLYYDNMQIGSHEIGKAIFSYNTGTMLQSNVYLYEITKDKKYLTEAIAIADSSMTYFYGSGKFRDDYWFNAVLLRGYQHLLKYYSDKKYISAFRVCTEEALLNNKNSLGLMGKEKPLELVPQSGMLEILARFAYLENSNQL